MQIERKTMKIKREDIDNMSHISVIAAIALPENLEEAARSIPDEVIKQGMVMEHCLYYSQVQNQHLDLENIVITDQHRYEGLAEALSDQIMAPYSMIPNEQTPKEFEDETEAAIREYETKRDDFVRLLNGRIVPIYDYGFSKDYVVKDGLICKRRFGPLQREKRTKKAKKMQLLLDCPFKKVYPAFVDYVLQYVGNEFLNWRSGYFYNPQGYWNSFVVGGRYRNQFLVPVDCPFAVTVYGDNVIEKHGINRDSTGDREKTRYLCGKQGIFTRDRALIRPGFIRQLETRASTRSASFFHALGSPGRPHNGGGEAGAYRIPATGQNP